MEAFEELRAFAQSLEGLAQQFDERGVNTSLEALENVISEVNASFSGSWMGYHAYTYYDGLQPPPASAHFDSLMGATRSFSGTHGNWVEYDPEAVKNYILREAEDPDIEELQRWGGTIREEFEGIKSEIISVLSNEKFTSDSFLSDLLNEAKAQKPLLEIHVKKRLQPQKMVTSDYTAVGQGFKTPPHIEMLIKVIPIRDTFNACKSLTNIANRAASHIQRKSTSSNIKRGGTHIFIGHGRSRLWRDLKDSLQDRLGLPWEEFNRVPVAGVTNIVRLSQMLDNSCIAFLVMTAEDELADGGVQARMNVVHEVGLFQGRLGFEKAIVLLEEGCEEFSNIHGLGQIRFPRDNIAVIFEDVRRVLEREGLLLNN